MPRALVVAAIGVCLGVSGAAGDEMQKTVKSIVAKDVWTVAEGTHNGKPLVIRFRSEFNEKPDVSQYPKRIKVSWSYDGGASGMPSAELSKSMEAFENRLVAAVESDVTAVLTAVITNDNRRIWVYYTSTVPTFGKRLNEMPQESKPYPIAIEASDDPTWRFLYDDVLAGIKDAGS
jgi:hypothetical protein